MYEFIFSCGHGRVVLNCSRRIGKTYLCVLIAIQFAMRNPKARIKFAASTADDLEEIILPIFEEILATCPKRLQPRWRAQKQKYTFPNKAEVKLAGCDDRRKANRLRGTAANLIIIEEAGSIPDLKYVVDSVLSPQLISTRGMMLFASTPPDSVGHEFVTIAEQAQEVGAYLHRDIFSCPRYSKEDREHLFRQMAGKMPLEEFYKTEDFRREFLAEFISDLSRQVLKNATLEHIGTPNSPGSVVKRYHEIQRPDFFVPYEGGDYGFNPDWTGWLFGYWHHEAQTLVVERELLIQRMTTDKLAQEIIAVEVEWLGPTRDARYLRQRVQPRRWADADERLVVDFSTRHNLLVHRTPKDDKDTAINNLDLMIPGFDGHLAISPTGCPELLKQMRACIWDKGRKKFARLLGYGHFDLVDALIYMARNVVRAENPVPAGLGYNSGTQFNPLHQRGALPPNAAAFKKMLFRN